MELFGSFVFPLQIFALTFEHFTCLGTHTVATDLGDIIGFSRKLLIKTEERTVRRYVGIPYAKPPLGDLRFKKSQELGKFTEPFKALKFGAACPQAGHPQLPILEDFSEDCLFLNVFVPTVTPDQTSGYPVMVYVHGGGLDYETGNTYIGDTLASFGNVIVVTLNYRLGLFGFFSTKDENAPGNAGLWDQHLAFKWVHKNIRAFGGDNGRVTIFGESAGGVSVLMQALYPGNTGFFQRVIAQSGSALMWSLFNEDHTDTNKKLAAAISCDVNDITNCLRHMTSSKILDTLTEITKDDMEAMFAFTFRPTVDNDFFQMSPFQMIKQQDKAMEELEFFRSLDVISGVTSDEGAYTVAQFLNDVDGELLPTREMMNTLLVPSASMFHTTNTFTDLVTSLIIHEYTDWSNPDDPQTIRAEFSRLLSDVIFHVGAVEQSRLHCSSRPTGRNYFYIFDTESNVGFFPKPRWSKGAIHAEDIGFVFGFDQEMLDIYKRSAYQRNDGSEIGICERELSERMMTYWTNFATYGDPTGQQNEGGQEWPRYDIDTQKALIISERYAGEDSIISFPFARAADFWTNIIPEALAVSRSAHATNSSSTISGSCSVDGDCDEV